MKKISIILAMAAVALGLSSCKQEDKPQYQTPTTFTISEPALKNQVFLCSDDMTDAATFNLFCSQPNYGYSAVCEYSALVSLDENAPIEEWKKLPNTTPNSAAMAIKTYELGVAINELMGITSYEDFVAGGYANDEFKCYFKAACEIKGIEGSYIVSSNTVSYDKVKIKYAEKKPAWIYIVGDVSNPVTGISNGFTAPSLGNLALYDANFRLYEPNDMIGEKLYVGVFDLDPKVYNPDKSAEDNCSQFRFMYELRGWDAGGSLASNKANFYCLNISDKYETGYTGDIVLDGDGNWGIWNADDGASKFPITIVVDQLNLKVYIKEGTHEVTFVGRDPEFN